uniref:Uncharacterized protein n=1 Tax=Parascaris equorum TaxID=6256 RepID=A0A914RSX4_PAREQ
MNLSPNTLRMFNITTSYYLVYLLTSSLFISVNAKPYASIDERDSHFLQESISKDNTLRAMVFFAVHQIFHNCTFSCFHVEAINRNRTQNYDNTLCKTNLHNMYNLQILDSGDDDDDDDDDVISDYKSDYTLEKKGMSMTKRWNGPTIDDIYRILGKNARNSRLRSRVARGDFRPSNDKSDYHPELWPLMPTLFSGFRERTYDSIID